MVRSTLKGVVTAALLALSAAAPTATAADPVPPDWIASGTGSTAPDPERGIDVDAFSGRSSHLGNFTGEGFHVLNPLDFTFAGQAAWTAANGDKLFASYTGQVFPSGDPDYPYGFVATLVADGGTGRLAGADGIAVMTGGFTGIPGRLYFDVDGTMLPNGK